MALNYKELKKQLDATPLSNRELSLIRDVEEYIDAEIMKQFDKSIYREVNIDLVYVRFDYSPTLKKPISDLEVSRKPLMQENLINRYKDADWEVTYRLDEGMSMCGADYMILKGKK